MKRTALLLSLIPMTLFLSGMGMDLGMGIGAADVGYGTKISAIEAFGDFPLFAPFSLRLSVSYLPPLLPREGPASAWEAGIMVSFGEKLLLQIGGSGGVLWEDQPLVRGDPITSVMAGITYFFDRLGIYLMGRFSMAYRSSPRGTYTYPYQVWALGILFKF